MSKLFERAFARTAMLRANISFSNFVIRRGGTSFSLLCPADPERGEDPGRDEPGARHPAHRDHPTQRTSRQWRRSLPACACLYAASANSWSMSPGAQMFLITIASPVRVLRMEPSG